MATSEVTICNLALGKLGAGSIISLDEESTEARVCRLHYTQTRDEVLRSHRWNFAIKSEELVQTVEVPPFGWAFQYALPTDCLRILEMNSYDLAQRPGTWEIEGRYLVTNDTSARVRYIRRITDCNLFDSLFVEALALRVASKIAMPLNGSMGMAESLLGQYEKLTGGRARRTDAFEAMPDRRPAWQASDLVYSRFQQGIT
jgi:hypothetical protein